MFCVSVVGPERGSAVKITRQEAVKAIRSTAGVSQEKRYHSQVEMQAVANTPNTAPPFLSELSAEP